MLRQDVTFTFKFISIPALACVLATCGNGEEEKTLNLHGNIEMTEVQVSFKTSGRIVELVVDEGDSVEAGQMVARLDTDTLQRQREEAVATKAMAESQLLQAGTALRLKKESVAAEIELHRAEVRRVQAHLDELLAGSRAQEVEQAEAAVAEARTRFEQAEADWNRAQTLHERDDISDTQFGQFKTAYESAGALLRQATERLALVKEGPRKEEIEAARAQLGREQAALRLAESQRLDIQLRQQEILTRKAEIERTVAQVGVLEQKIEETTARSPVAGVVLVKSAEQGEVISAGAPILTIADLDHPWLRGYVNETDLGRVQLGAEVDVTTDSFPGKAYRGRISFIASEAEFTPKTIQTTEERVKLVYRIKVDINNEGHELKLNMPVDAEIHLNSR